jgi:DnaD/phage-associated family protein
LLDSSKVVTLFFFQFNKNVDQHDYTLIRAALDEAYSHDKLSFKYVDRILLNWKKNNVTTMQHVLKCNHVGLHQSIG